MRISILIFIYTIHFAYLKCTHNFIILNQVVAEKTDQKKKHPYVLYRSDRRKIEKECKMSFSIFIFIYTIHLAYLKVYTKFKNTGSSKSQEICERNFHWREKKNEQIKGLICYMLLFFVTQYNSSLSSFVPNFRILSQVVAVKSLTDKKSPYELYKSDRGKK